MKLSGKKVAVLVENGFEEIELTSPVEALKEAGAAVTIISPVDNKVKAWDTDDWGGEYDVDLNLSKANAEDYNALLLPGGVMNPDKLRVNEDALSFVKNFFKAVKPVAAICHAPWTLINAGVIEGRKVTSFKTVRKDLENAGAIWEDSEVVVDQGLVTSRNPDDLPAFNKKLVEEVREGVHEGQTA